MKFFSAFNEEIFVFVSKNYVHFLVSDWLKFIYKRNALNIETGKELQHFNKILSSLKARALKTFNLKYHFG